MIILLYLICIAWIFYLLIPGLGAFYIRSRWRVFRNSVLETSLYSTLTYSDIRSGRGFIGQFRMIGRYQGIEENERIIWLKNDSISVKVDISNADIYLLPTSSGLEFEGRVERNDLLSSTGSLQKISWKDVYSIDDGSEFLIAGPVFVVDGTAHFRSTKNNKLLVLQYDGDAKTIMRRSIWAGRQRNEFWNVFTPGSLLLGSFSLFIFSYLIYTGTRDIDAVSVAVALSLLPLVPFLPPGVLFFYIYRSLWEQGRTLRAERDLFMLPVRFISEPENLGESNLYLPDGELYGIRKLVDLRDLEKAEGKLRLSRIVNHTDASATEYFGFGRVDRPEDNTLRPLDDPLVENVILPGSPAALSRDCGKKARRLEIIAGGSFILGFMINAVLVFIGVALLLK